MKLSEMKILIEELSELYPDCESRLVLTLDNKDQIKDIKSMGYFAHVEGSAYAKEEVVVRDKINENSGSTRSEASSS